MSDPLCKILLTALHAGKFFRLLLLSADFFSKFKKNQDNYQY